MVKEEHTMPRRGENIYRRKDGRWEGRYICGYHENGRASYRSVYGKSYTAVKEKLEQEKEKARKGLLQGCGLTVQELMELWLNSRRVKASSYARYHALIQGHILPQLGKYAVRSLTANQLERFVKQLLESGRSDGRGGLSPKTVSDTLAAVKSALKLAQKSYGFVDLNSVQGVTGPKPVPHRVETFSDHEAAKLTDALVHDGSRSAVSILLCLNTGLRLGELCGLRWSDLNRLDHTLHIRRTAQRIRDKEQTRLITQPPKSEASDRIIPVQPELVRLLTAFDDGHDSYILTGTEQPMEPRTMQYRFRRLLQSNGLPQHSFHVLRHTFATRCAAVGGDAKCLSEILGHANVRITLQLYVHPCLEHKRACVNAASTLPQITQEEYSPSIIWSALEENR